MAEGLNWSNKSQFRSSNKTMDKERFIFYLTANPERDIYLKLLVKNFFLPIEEIRA